MEPGRAAVVLYVAEIACPADPPVGAGLPAMAVVQALLLVSDTPPSQPSQLPQLMCGVCKVRDPLWEQSRLYKHQAQTLK